MTFTYDESHGSFPRAVELVRILVGDTKKSNDQLVTDEAIEPFLTEAGLSLTDTGKEIKDVLRPAVQLVDHIIAIHTLDVDSTISGNSNARAQVIANFEALRKKLNARLAGQGGIAYPANLVANKTAYNENTARSQPTFCLGQDDYP